MRSDRRIDGQAGGKGERSKWNHRGEVVDLLIHLVRRLHHFGIGLVGALATIRLMNSSTTLTLDCSV